MYETKQTHTDSGDIIKQPNRLVCASVCLVLTTDSGQDCCDKVGMLRPCQESGCGYSLVMRGLRTPP